eukprot:Phypoly_transcript_03583.p1 GENE.Phypoly_transcript_03583~~Phypoly_transcript_03583.p1  ORF type:complete len:722 (+),score=123.02 Phypoly_transcript_03583:31-2166(+)
MDPPDPSPLHPTPVPTPLNNGAPGSLKLVLKLPKASYEQAVAKANLKRSKHSSTEQPLKHSHPPLYVPFDPTTSYPRPPTPLSLVPGFPPPEHPTATPTTPIRYATPHTSHSSSFFNEVNPESDIAPKFATPPPKKVGKKRKTMELASPAHNHSSAIHDTPLLEDGSLVVVSTSSSSAIPAPIATPTPTSTKKRSIRRDSSGISPSNPPFPTSPTTPTTPTNPSKPRKLMSARARKNEAKQQLAVDEEVYTHTMEILEVEEDINSLEEEIKRLEHSKLTMRKEFAFLESIPIQQAPRVVEEEQQSSCDGNGPFGGIVVNGGGRPIYGNMGNGYTMVGHGKSAGENNTLDFFDGAHHANYATHHHHHPLAGLLPPARAANFTVKIAPPPSSTPRFPTMNNIIPNSTYHPFGTDQLSAYPPANSFDESAYLPAHVRPSSSYHLPYNSYHNMPSSMTSPPTSPPPTSPPTSPPTTLNPSYSSPPHFTHLNSNTSYISPVHMPRPLIHASEPIVYPIATCTPPGPLPTFTSPSAKPPLGLSKQAPITPLTAQSKHSVLTHIPSPTLKSHQPPAVDSPASISLHTTTTTAPNTIKAMAKPAPKTPPHPPVASVQVQPILPPQILKVPHSRPRPHPPPQAIKPFAPPTAPGISSSPSILHRAPLPASTTPPSSSPAASSFPHLPFSSSASPSPLKPTKPLKPVIPSPASTLLNSSVP